MKVRLSPTARVQIAELADWWDTHRHDARVRVEDALEEVVASIAEQPGLGPVYSGDPRYRTWRLKGMPYLLFYRADAAADTIWIVAAWSAMRGTRPELP